MSCGYFLWIICWITPAEILRPPRAKRSSRIPAVSGHRLQVVFSIYNPFPALTRGQRPGLDVADQRLVCISVQLFCLGGVGKKENTPRNTTVFFSDTSISVPFSLTGHEQLVQKHPANLRLHFFVFSFKGCESARGPICVFLWGWDCNFSVCIR